jgi:hypothetical protein
MRRGKIPREIESPENIQAAVERFAGIDPKLKEKAEHFFQETKPYPHVIQDCNSFIDSLEEGATHIPGISQKVIQNNASTYLDSHEYIPGTIRHQADTAIIGYNSIALFHEKLGIPKKDLARILAEVKLSGSLHDIGKGFGGDQMVKLKMMHESRAIISASQLPLDKINQILQGAMGNPKSIDKILQVVERIKKKPSLIFEAQDYQLNDSSEILEAVINFWKILVFDADWEDIGQSELCKVVKQHDIIGAHLLRKNGNPEAICQIVETHHQPYHKIKFDDLKSGISQCTVSASDVLSSLIGRKNFKAFGRHEARDPKDAFIETLLCSNSQLAPCVISAWLDAAKPLYAEDSELVFQFNKSHKYRLGEHEGGFEGLAKRLVDDIDERWPKILQRADAETKRALTKSLVTKLENEFELGAENFNIALSRIDKNALAIESTHTGREILEKRIISDARKGLRLVWERITSHPVVEPPIRAVA